MSAIQESIKEMTVEELLSLIAAATAEAKKKAKGSKAAKEPKGSKEQKASKEPKKGSMVKGVLPPQLHESFAWVDFVLADAKANGWTAYAVKGKEEMEAASEERDGVHVFPNGKVFNRKNAMSLSKFYFSKKEGKGANEELYQQFAAQYVAPSPASPSADAVAKAVTEAVTEAMASPVASPKKKAPKAEPKTTPAPKAKAAPAAPKKKKVEDEWLTTCPKDDAVYPWEFEGAKYARNYKNHVYSVDEDGEPAYWVGLFNGTEIDKSVAEPEE